MTAWIHKKNNMARTTGKSGFKMRSGNKPTFAKMGVSPANMRNFGIGKGMSPYKYDVKGGDTLSKIAKANNTTVEELMKANPDIKDANKIQAGMNLKMPDTKTEEKTNVEKKNEDLKADDLNTEKEIVKKKPRTLEKIAKIGVAALTGGLDAVYGTGKVQFAPGGTRLTTKEVGDDKKNKSLLDKEKEVDEKIK
tara:strand:- start:2380 stop:2961 length:582 start_codon:yes stop_codon:yes gene_type:complete